MGRSLQTAPPPACREEFTGHGVEHDSDDDVALDCEGDRNGIQADPVRVVGCSVQRVYDPSAGTIAGVTAALLSQNAVVGKPGADHLQNAFFRGGVGLGDRDR